MAAELVERRETGFYIARSRVPVDRIVSEYRNGEDPAAIQSHYPTLTLDEVRGASAFYSDHREEVDRAMDERRKAEDAYAGGHSNPPEIAEKFERMRREAAHRR